MKITFVGRLVIAAITGVLVAVAFHSSAAEAAVSGTFVCDAGVYDDFDKQNERPDNVYPQSHTVKVNAGGMIIRKVGGRWSEGITLMVNFDQLGKQKGPEDRTLYGDKTEHGVAQFMEGKPVFVYFNKSTGDVVEFTNCKAERKF